jgi:3-hydroxyacyl-[acyl-carrier-protein] dehydratase
MNEMSIEDIMHTLPHRYPILLVDRVLDYDLDERVIRAVKNISFNEPVLQGHFPGQPIMPGVIQIEALAQAAGILLNKLSGREGKIALFTSIEKARFRRKIVPGDVMFMEARVTRSRTNFARVEGLIKVGDELATEAEMSFAFQK